MRNRVFRNKAKFGIFEQKLSNIFNIKTFVSSGIWSNNLRPVSLTLSLGHSGIGY